MRWRQFCAELLAACDELGGQLVVTLGALLADTPHTRPIPVTGHRDRARPRRPAQARAVDVRGPDRHRRRLPGRLRPARHPGGVLLGRGPPLRRPAAVPQGDAGAARPARGPAARRASRCGDLPEEARAWERGVDELAEEDEDVADYVRALEETRDTADLPEAVGRGDRPRVRALPQAQPQARRTARPPATRCRPTATGRAPRREPVDGGRGGAGRWCRPARPCRGSRRPRPGRPPAPSARRGRRPAPRARRSTTGAAGAPAPSASARRQSASVSTASQSSASVHSQSAR